MKVATIYWTTKGIESHGKTTTRFNQPKLTFTKLQFVQDGGFTGSIKSDHEDSHLLLAELHCW
jgi:hypothetical protein